MEKYIIWGIAILLLINTLGAVFTVFKEKRSIAAIWAWLLVLFMLPIAGFIIYYFLGRKISKEEIFHLQNQEALGMTTLIEHHIDEEGRHKNLEHYTPYTQELISLLFNSDFSIMTQHNEVKIIADGTEKMAQLLADIQNAKKHIHMQYYIFTCDNVGQQVMDALVAKAKEGVEVLFLYDALGSRKLKNSQLADLVAAGGQVATFFGRRRISIVNFRMNFRNHRKIVVIDGQIGYLGGFNIAKEYIGEGPLGNWRDTHLRLIGNAVQALQSQFFMDWYANKKKIPAKLKADYFPEYNYAGDVPVQIVASGPESEADQIKWGYIKMINMATKQINIQTPYFIPDESVFEAIQIAALSGIEVNIMIPCQPDHIFVYRASEYYCKSIINSGVNIYRYDDGFLHSKVLTIDGQIASVGTANFDIRSFKLNFEINAFIYNRETVRELNQNFAEDMTKSTKLDAEYFEQQSAWKKFKQNFSRLFSPIL